ncbi:MAG: FAD-binding oxidoreductase [Actinobacteria bacterium]|nr:FAD-binding oxidoreductase [Actinomycetota bacterium]
MISDEAYEELEKVVGPENVSREPAVLDGYAWQPMINDDPAKWIKRPVAVVLPSSTQEVQEVVRTCNRHGLRFKAFATGWGIYGGPTYDNVVQIELRRMNRILEIDEKNMYAVVEPYVTGAQLQAEAMKLGLNTHIIGAGPVCSPLASATSGWGVGWDGIYMGYSPRNVLGLEWVLPDGEIVRLGTLGSESGWYSGDGPGPSLRGLVRGSTGALGGLGVFTRGALKLYSWPGKPQVDIQGMLLDAQAEVPEHARFHICFFPDRNSSAEAVYKIGEAEIGYLATKTSTAAFIYTFAPHLLRKITRTTALRGILSGALRWTFVIMLAGHTPQEIAYQEAALKEILADYGGMSMEAMQTPVIGPMVFMNFFRVTAIPMAFRMGGLFCSFLGRNETWDMQLDWYEKGEEIKKEYIASGGILDDLNDNPFMALFDNNTFSHCEVIFQYDPRDIEQFKSVEPMQIEAMINAVEMCQEQLSVCDARQRKVLSPLAGHFNRWQRKISEVFDGNRAADSGMYCDEEDYDYSKIGADLKARMDRLVAERTWTEEGPPG